MEPAQYELGCLLYDPNFKFGQNDYGKQIGPPKTNLREAAKWYEKAEAQGEEWAAYRLAHMYRNVSPRSPEKAALWERKGNELRHGDDFRSHSRRNASDVFSRMLGGGVCPSIDKSTEIEARISIAAEQGDPDALIAIGHLYERGACISAAVECYDRAAKRGNSDALVRLAWFYFDGRGVMRDRAYAFELFRCAADMGDFRAQFQLAWMYENGVGIDRNPQIAGELNRKVEDTMDAHRLCELASIYSRGSGVERSEQTAAKLYRKAAELGDRFAQYLLGSFYERGKGLLRITKWPRHGTGRRPIKAILTRNTISRPFISMGKVLRRMLMRQCAGVRNQRSRMTRMHFFSLHNCMNQAQGFSRTYVRQLVCTPGCKETM